ncbi:transporter [Salipaludibacillus keqinensis]|uniref:Transporter n=1 Tax=Salipaludibacillus keqinensis TaxID=2045207 RepID=A0A323TZF0_9BACI|nr:potassium channel family protein [Salipaludibacillus keqinensis]PYZ94965.1 transporter [Salipaludibacillus keqinensis]
MISFLITLQRMLRAIIRGLKEPEFQVLLTLTILTLISGTIFYSTVENLRILDALYFSVTTLSTVGYGDFSPQTDFGKVFTIVYIFAGIGIIVAFVTKIYEYTQQGRIDVKQKKKEKINRGDGSPG